MTTREEEMAKLRDRYASSRGKEQTVLPPATNEKQTVEPEKKIKERRKVKEVIEPYLFLIKNDLRRLFRMKPKEQKQKPLDLTWLEKKGGKFF